MNRTNIIILVGTFIFLSLIQHYIYKYKYSKEGMESGKKQIIKNVYLIGDSIIKNDLYVSKEKSVENHINNLLKSNKSGEIDDNLRINVNNLAVDNSVINDIYDQIKFIPEDSKDMNVIILSVGGNDILRKYVYMYNTDFVGLTTLFNKYKQLVERIKSRFPEPDYKLVIMNIYYPPDKQMFSPFYPHIKEWNKSIDNLVNKSNNDIGLIRIDEKITDKEDFVNKIEPSEIGGEKIAREIIQFL